MFFERGHCQLPKVRFMIGHEKVDVAALRFIGIVQYVTKYIYQIKIQTNPIPQSGYVKPEICGLL